MGAAASTNTGKLDLKSAGFPADFLGLELTLTIHEGRNLVAMDGGMFTKKSSDPYVNVEVGRGNIIAKTETIMKDLNPKWKEKVCVGAWIGPKKTVAADPNIRLSVWDYDTISDDDEMGEIVIPLFKPHEQLPDLLAGDKEYDVWLPITATSGCPKVSKNDDCSKSAECRVQECKSARVQECKSARVQECKSARVQECKRSSLRESS